MVYTYIYIYVYMHENVKPQTRVSVFKRQDMICRSHIRRDMQHESPAPKSIGDLIIFDWNTAEYT
jgi:hypothetical protein